MFFNLFPEAYRAGDLVSFVFTELMEGAGFFEKSHPRPWTTVESKLFLTQVSGLLIFFHSVNPADTKEKRPLLAKTTILNKNTCTVGSVEW